MVFVPLGSIVHAVRVSGASVWVEPEAGRHRGVELAVEIARHLARRRVCVPGLAAFGAVLEDGRLAEAEAPRAAALPGSPWVGRFWAPVPGAALLTIVDVSTVARALEVAAMFAQFDRRGRRLR